MKFSLVANRIEKRNQRGAFADYRRSGWLALLGLAIILTACSGSVAALDPAGASATAEVQPSATAAPTETAAPTATFTPLPPTATPSPMPTATPPSAFRPEVLRKGITPVGYLPDACSAIQLRWDPERAEPGTMVVPIMFHSVIKDGRPLADNISIHDGELKQFMEEARRLGFETITTAQLLDFLQNNTRIPPRSLLLILDDRRQGVVWNNFLPFLQQYNWKLTLAYITGPVVSEWEWGELKRLSDTGFVDVQAHGYLHNGESYITEFTKPEIVTQELVRPIEQIQKYLGQTPIAFVWPGGNFTAQSVQQARATGYQLGFTAQARGPILFDWVPQGDEELAAGDPLMTLPRYWSTSASTALYDAMLISDAVRQNAGDQKAADLAWYAANCSAYPPIP